MKTYHLITAPAQDVVSLDEAKAQLRVTGSSQDDLISATVDAVTATLDPAAGGWLGRALRPQTWELRAGSFYECGHSDRYNVSNGPIELRYPPLISIDSVKYDDPAGVEHTLTEGTDFTVQGEGALGKQSIRPVYLGFWPIARCYPESVRIRYTCGYDSDEDTMPAAIKQAIHLGVRNLYSLGERNLFQSLSAVTGVSETRYVVSPAGSELIMTAMENILSTYRAW